MGAVRNLEVEIRCPSCSRPFHPWRGREASSKTCGRACYGKLLYEMNAANEGRFESFFAKTDGCWLWKGTLAAGGYGYFYTGRARVRAHRFAFEKYNGPIPEGQFVCHSCDTPACVNPEHLWLGSVQDNSSDMVAKGRGTTGRCLLHSESHPRSKITRQIALCIRYDARSNAAIAQEYKISPSLVSGIKRGTHWKYA